MERSILRELRRTQFRAIVSFAVLVFSLTSLLLWTHTVRIYRERLMTLSKILQAEVEDQLKQAKNIHNIQPAIQEEIDRMVSSLSVEFTVGLYSRELDQVIAAASGETGLNILGAKLAPGDPGRECWRTKRPTIATLWSSVRKVWIMKCDSPISADGIVVGHIFVNITLVKLMKIEGVLVAGLILIVGAAGVLSSASSRKLAATLKKNLDRLLFPRVVGTGPFDYEEFDRINAMNQAVEIELYRSQQRMACILEGITDAFFALDTNWRFTYVNREAERIMGRSGEDLVGQCFWDVFPSAREFDFFNRLGNTVFCQQALHVEFQALGLWFEAHAYPYTEGFSVHFRYITERRRAEEELKYLAAIVQSSYDGIIGFGVDGVVSSWNAGAERMYGYRADEIIGRSVTMIMPPELQWQFDDIRREISLGRDVSLSETERMRADGSRITVSIQVAIIRNADEKVIGAASIHRDVSERKRFEQALDAEREQLLVTLNSLCDGVIATNCDGHISMVNLAAKSITGWTVEEALGRPVESVLALKNSGGKEGACSAAPVTSPSGEYRATSDGLLITRDGREVPISYSIAPIRATGQDPIGVVFVFQDTTEKQRIEAELLKAEKLESLGTLAGGIAHDFNNILAASLANIQLALVRAKKNGDFEQCLQNTIGIIHQASNLTKQLLTFSKGGAPVRKPVPLAELVREHAEFVLRGSSIGCRLQLSGDLWAADIDEGQISQVIGNLVINAKQAMPEGGLVTVSAWNTVLEGSAGRAGRYVAVSVKDSGPGIHEALLSKIFDPFFTTKPEGTGLGLSTSYSIVRQHRGHIEVSSQPGQGATFTVFLPASDQPVAPTDLPHEVQATAAGATVLLMDDNEMVLDVIGEMLTHLGYRVLKAREGKQALALYRKACSRGRAIDAVVMDLTIPGGMGGRETIACLRQIDPNVRAIVSSGYANDPIMADYRAHGFYGVVTKPFRIDELHSVLTALIEEGRHRREWAQEFRRENGSDSDCAIPGTVAST